MALPNLRARFRTRLTTRFTTAALAGLAALLFASVGHAESSGYANFDPRLPALMPYPQQLRPQSSEPLRLDDSSRLCFIATPGPRLAAASERFRARLQRQQNITLPPAGPCASLTDIEATSRIEISVESAAENSEENTLAALDVNRSRYRLQVETDKIHLSAHSETGLLHGLQTLSQYIGSDENGLTAGYEMLPCVEIVDYPRFRWRGLMLDSARHFFSVDTIKRQLDGMAAAKLNVFHWHLTDDQGWRLQSRAYPHLHETAPGGNFYTREQVREIVTYAADRGIAVVPEIDMPGHASAIAVAYPELMSAPGPYAPEDRWGVHKPLLNPANPEVYTFAEKILAEVAELFPFEYVHIGGDEVDPQHWESNAEIQQFMREHQLADSHALHNYFNGRLAEILAKLDRKMIGWDEILHPGLAQSAAVQSWRGPDALGDIARAGHHGILSTGFYLDQPQYTSYHYRNGIIPTPLDFTAIQPNEQWQTWHFSAPRKRGGPVSGTFTLVESAEGYLRGVMTFAGKEPQRLRRVEHADGHTLFTLDTWMGPMRARLRLEDTALTGELVVGNAPYAVTGELAAGSQMESTAPVFSSSRPALTDSRKKNILGGEVALWAEMIDEHSIDLRLWPRAFAVAERLWSAKEMQREDMLYQRLPSIGHWAETAVGLQHRAQQTAALQKLFAEHLQAQAMDFSAVLEPAHYYHRHHEKSAHETYSRRDPLNRFADSLPVESTALRELRQLAEYLPENPTSELTTAPLHDGLLHLWRAGVAAETLLQQREQLRADVQQLAELVRQQMELGFLVTSRYVDKQPFAPDEETAIRAQIDSLKGIHSEVVLPAVYVLERMMDRLQYSGIGANNIGANNISANNSADKQHG